MEFKLSVRILNILTFETVFILSCPILILLLVRSDVTVFAKQVKLTKFWVDATYRKKIKSLRQILRKIGPL